jgi:signal peptidase II
MIPSLKLRFMLMFMIMVACVGCDQVSKQVARVRLEELGSVQLPGGFGELRLAQNPGSFLSLGASLPDSVRTAIFTVATGLALAGMMFYMLANGKLALAPFIGLSLVLGGGIGNLIDRVGRKGLVTDFIYLHAGVLHTGVFNVADMLIMAGIGVFAVASWKTSDKADGKVEPLQSSHS